MKILIKFIILVVLMPLYLCAQESNDNIIEISLTLPALQAEPYHRPYVAVWLETPNRKGVHTFVFWREQEDWFKDLRQWWRKIGRKKSPAFDAATGATKKPGTYHITWNGMLADNTKLSGGDYVLHFESVREQGSREYLRQSITLKANTEKQTYTLEGQEELGLITITVN